MSEVSDTRKSFMIAVLDALIVFVFSLPTSRFPTTLDIYVALKVSIVVFVYSLAKSMKLKLHFKELLNGFNNGNGGDDKHAHKKR